MKSAAIYGSFFVCLGTAYEHLPKTNTPECKLAHTELS